MAALCLVLVGAPGRAADLENLPPEVREGISRVGVDWTPWRDLLREAVEVAPSTVDPAPLWETFLVELLIRGGVSTEEWQDLLEQREADAETVCSIWRGLWFTDPEAIESMGWVRPFWEAAAALIPPDQRDPSTLPFDQALALGEMQFWSGDIEGAQKVYEAVFGRLPEGPPTEGRVCRGLMAYRIAQCFEKKLDVRGALEWYRKAAEWGTPEQTGGYDLKGEALVEAARMCRALGRYAEADKYYKQAVAECIGWGQAVALLDLARIRLNEGDEEEAERVYEEGAELCGQGWGAAKLWMRLAHRTYRRGDQEAALEYCQRIMETLGGSPWPSAERMANAAGDMIDRIHQWDAQPLQVSPEELRLEGGEAVKFVVITWQEPPIQTTTDVACIEVSLSDTSPKKPGEVSRTFEVSLKEDAQPGTYEGKIVLTTTEARPFELPITVVVPAG
jgi:tetratricopeptide (TPR) repeat protein